MTKHLAALALAPSYSRLRAKSRHGAAGPIQSSCRTADDDRDDGSAGRYTITKSSKRNFVAVFARSRDGTLTACRTSRRRRGHGRVSAHRRGDPEPRRTTSVRGERRLQRCLCIACGRERLSLLSRTPSGARSETAHSVPQSVYVLNTAALEISPLQTQ